MGILLLLSQKAKTKHPRTQNQTNYTSLLRWIFEGVPRGAHPCLPPGQVLHFLHCCYLVYLLEYYPYFSFPSVFSRGLITGFIVFNGGSHFQFQHRLDLPTQQTNNQST